MEIPVWKDRVWLALVLGPFAWMAVFFLFLDRASMHPLSLWTIGLCLSVSAVSIFFPAIRGHIRQRD
jgi:hypothetical protein